MYLKENRKSSRVDFMAVSESISESRQVNFSWKFVSIYLLAIVIFTFLLVNLFNLQIVEGSQNLLIASRINQTTNTIVPPRGIIYDDKGKKLAYNIPAYSLYVNPFEIESDDEERIINEIAEILDEDTKEFRKTFKSKVYKDGEIVPLERVTIRADLDFDDYLALISIIDDYQGYYIIAEPVRTYVDGEYFSHILGYLGDPNEADVQAGIYSESQIGKIGIEKIYDEYLRGVEGVEITETGIIDRRQRVYTPQQARYGDNLHLTINSRWQKKLTKIMQDQLEAVDAFASVGVIINSNTGEVKALVSVPSYDNNLFSKGISAKDFNELLNDPRTPLLNRVVGLQLPSGSIWKTIGATAALEEGVISEYTEFTANGCMELPGDIKFCEADLAYLGSVNVREALTRSSNIFFCNVALQINSEARGIRTLINYANQYGIGKLTGIDITGEQTGTMASPELKEKLLGEPWYIGDECNTIIGQGLVTVTPIQMAVVASAIKNGGNIMEPHILARVENQVGETVYTKKPKVVRKLKVSEHTLDIIEDGMREAAVSGTASQLAGLPGNIIAKTGSADAAEVIQGEVHSGAHSWVMGCFDYGGEEYCFVTMQQWGGRGYQTVPIMKKFINCLYNSFEVNCEAI